MKISQSIITIHLGNVNVYAIKQNSTLMLIDTGRKGDANRIVKGLNSNGADIGDVDIIVVTHGHTDHTGSLLELKKRSGARIIAHELDTPFIRRGVNAEIVTHSPLTGLFMKFAGHSEVDPCEPDHFVQDEFDLAPYGIDGRIIHTPGHTHGSVTVILGNGNAFIGDMLAPDHNKSAATLPSIFSDLEELKNSLKKVASYDPQTTFLSHGGEVGLKQLKTVFEGGRME